MESIRYVEHGSEELITMLGRKYTDAKKMAAYWKRKFAVVGLESVSVPKSLNQSTDQELTACVRGLRVEHQAEEARQKLIDVQSPSLARSALTKIWEVSNCNSLG